MKIKLRMLIAVTAIVLLGKTLSAEPPHPIQNFAIRSVFLGHNQALKPPVVETIHELPLQITPAPFYFNYVNQELWSYLRSGLNYLESPSPLAPPESIPPSYIHPDAKGFGAYGLSPEAYEDVQRVYPFFKQYRWEDIMRSNKLYDLANQAFADWLLGNLQDYLPPQASKHQIFEVLHQAWNTGLSGFKNGRRVIESRTRRALEFTANAASEETS